MSLTSREGFYKTLAVQVISSCRSVEEVIECLKLVHNKTMLRLCEGNLQDATQGMELEKVLFDEARRRGFFNAKSGSDSVGRYFDFDAAGGIRQ